MRNYVFVVFAFLLFTSCKENSIDYKQDLASYLEKEHSKEMEDALYIVIPVHSCNDCRNIVYRNLLTTSHKKNIKIIFSGQVREALTNHYLGRLGIMGVELLYDQSEKAKEYGLIQEEYPMQMLSFIDVIQGEVSSYDILKPNMVNGEIDIRKEIFKSYIN